MANAAVRTGPEVNKNHGNWRPTEDIRSTLSEKFPGLDFPYLDMDHTHGVHSSVHCYCEKHQVFTRVALAGALYETTQYACSICATEAGMKTRKANGFSTKQYIGKPGVQSGIFRAVKTVFPDAIWEHTMSCGKEIDIWVPSIGVGVEYNGNYYHSTACQSDLKYHAKKTVAGQKEGKGILHVFTDEAVEPYTNIIRVIQMAGGAFTYEANKRDVIAVCDPATALEFYREWNFVNPKLVENVCDTHVGLFRRGGLVALVSGIRSSRKILRTAMRLHGVPLNSLLRAFEKVVGGSCAVWADLRNPVEAVAWTLNGKFHSYQSPIGFGLDKNYNILYRHVDPEEGLQFIYDSGHYVVTAE